MGLVDTREALIDPLDEMRRTSLDPYVTYRSAFRQRRQADIEIRIGPPGTSSTGAFLPSPAEKRWMTNTLRQICTDLLRRPVGR
jgi:hypothetical protein